MVIPSTSHRERAVAYLVGNENYTWVHYSDGSKKLMTKTLHLLMEDGFIRISKKMAVNPLFIRKVRASQNRWGSQQLDLKMKDGSVLPVSRRRITTIKQVLAQ